MLCSQCDRSHFCSFDKTSCICYFNLVAKVLLSFCHFCNQSEDVAAVFLSHAVDDRLRWDHFFSAQVRRDDWLIDWFYTVTSVCWVTDRRKRVGQHKKDFNSKFKFKREKSNIKSLSEWAMNQIVSQLPRSRRWGEVPSLSGHRTLLMLSWRTVTGAGYHQFCRVLVMNLVNVSPQSWLFLLRGTWTCEPDLISNHHRVVEEISVWPKVVNWHIDQRHPRFSRAAAWLKVCRELDTVSRDGVPFSPNEVTLWVHTMKKPLRASSHLLF